MNQINNNKSKKKYWGWDRENRVSTESHKAQSGLKITILLKLAFN